MGLFANNDSAIQRIIVSSLFPSLSTESTARCLSVTKQIIGVLVRGGIAGGVAVGAIALGIALAHNSPAQNPSPPLFLRVFWWSTNHYPGSAAPKTNEVIANLSAEDKRAIELEIVGIQQQLQVLAERTKRLEQELDLNSRYASLDHRLKRLKSSLNANFSDITAETQPDSRSSEVPKSLKITLPSDRLFDEGQLTSEAEEILSAIAVDLQKSESHTITIAAHSFPEDDQIALNQSFQQAQMIRGYLSKQVQGDRRWLIIGRGASRPLNTENNQANPRIEITSE